MPVKIDLSGRRYGSLTVIRLAVDIPGKKKKWICRCDCGRETIVSACNLRNGHTKHCSKCGYKAMSEKNRTHGGTGSNLYLVWCTMRNRCERTGVKSYSDYGGRGVSVCEEWKDFQNFKSWALSNGYEHGLEIDRMNVNGDYCPENCRWVTRLINANNKRNNRVVEYNGEKKTLAEWARYYGVNYKLLHKHVSAGYSFTDAINKQK